MNVQHGERFEVTSLSEFTAIDRRKSELLQKRANLFFRGSVIAAVEHGCFVAIEVGIEHGIDAGRVERFNDPCISSMLCDLFRSTGLVTEL